MGKFKFIFCTQIVQLMEVCYQSEELVARNEFVRLLNGRHALIGRCFAPEWWRIALERAENQTMKDLIKPDNEAEANVIKSILEEHGMEVDPIDWTAWWVG